MSRNDRNQVMEPEQQSAQQRALTNAFLGLAYQDQFTRRDVFKGLLAASAAAVLMGSPLTAKAAPSASQETLDALSDAQSQLDAVQAQLDEIAAQFQALTKQQSETLDKIEDVQLQIDDTQADIDEKQEELDEKQGQLAERVTTSYKQGGNDALSLLLSSSSFDELISNVYYIDKMNQNDQEAIAEVQRIQKELSQRKEELEGQKADLEELREAQQAQLTEMQNKQAEVQEVVNGLSADVQELMAQRDAEVLAAIQAEEEQKKQWEQNQTGPIYSGGGSTGGSTGGGGTDWQGGTPGSSGGISGAQQRVVNACYSTPSPGANYCAMWVSQVFSRAGIGYPSGNANDMYYSWCTYSSKDQLQAGMIVGVSTYNGNWAGQMYGHVGIYVGDGIVMENIGYINSNPIDSWCAYYGNAVAPRWGWVFGQNLSQMG